MPAVYQVLCLVRGERMLTQTDALLSWGALSLGLNSHAAVFASPGVGGATEFNRDFIEGTCVHEWAMDLPRGLSTGL